MICVPRVNTPTCNELAASSRRSDFAMQEIQKMIVKTGQVLSTITDKVLLANALSLVGHAGFLTSLKRRFLLKRQLRKNFESLSTPVTAWPFGDDLSKNVDEITKANKVATKSRSGYFGQPAPLLSTVLLLLLYNYCIIVISLL